MCFQFVVFIGIFIRSCAHVFPEVAAIWICFRDCRIHDRQFFFSGIMHAEREGRTIQIVPGSSGPVVCEKVWE